MSWSDATHELAWAAGFFDGEGSTGVSPARKVGSVRLFASVPQASSSPERLPSVLIRFHRAVAGLGHIGNPYLDPRSGTHIFQWRTDNLEEVQAVIALLWSELGPVKRSQANRALTSFAQQFRTRRFRRRRPKTARRLLLDRGRALRFRRRSSRGHLVCSMPRGRRSCSCAAGKTKCSSACAARCRNAMRVGSLKSSCVSKPRSRAGGSRVRRPATVMRTHTSGQPGPLIRSRAWRSSGPSSA